MTDFEIESDIDKEKIDENKHFFIEVSYTGKAHVVNDESQAKERLNMMELELEEAVSGEPTLNSTSTELKSEPSRVHTGTEDGGKSEDENVLVQCQGTTADGSRCERMTTDDSGYCYQHR